MKQIWFNKPYLTGNELRYISEAVIRKHISGNGFYTKKCHEIFQEQFNFKKCLLTNSCTDALEMCALLLDIKEGDEVIVPAFTFVTTATAFILRGAKIVFADSRVDNPNIDAELIEPLVTSRTKAIVVVHYAGVACEMDSISALAEKYHFFVIEDAAQAIDSYYKGKVLGSMGHLAAFSFHETKNITSGEGGLLVVNDERFQKRADIIWEKGTNRKAFFEGHVNKYEWVDVGSSFLPSDLIAAFLVAQLENISVIQNKRKKIWEYYREKLKVLEEQGHLGLSKIPSYASNNGHMFYVLCKNIEDRSLLIEYLRTKHINAVFHYQSLHKSPFYSKRHDGRSLPMSDLYSDRLLRLPFYYELTSEDQDKVIETIFSFFNQTTALFV